MNDANEATQIASMTLALAQDRAADTQAEAIREIERAISRLQEVRKDIEAGHISYHVHGIRLDEVSNRIVRAAASAEWVKEMVEVGGLLGVKPASE